MGWMDDEPVRGSYPDVRLIGLPGSERAGRPGRRYIPPPPIHYLFGVEPVESGPGWSTFRMPATPWLQTSAGIFFAGTAALVADAPLGSAIISVLPPGVFGVTSDLSINFLRPVTVASGHLTARARLIDAGRTVGLSEALVEDGHGRLVAHMTSRYFLTALQPAPDPAGIEPAPVPTYGTPHPFERPLPPDRVLAADVWERHSGREIFALSRAGEIPPAPFMELFGISRPEPEDGRFSFSVRASEWFNSPARTIYGGVLAFFADAALTGAVSTTLPAKAISAGLDLKVNFLRPGIADGRILTARAEVIHRGRTLAVARGEIVNEDGKALVTALGSMAIAEGRSWGSLAVADEISAE